ncbi:hypothetical protein ACFFX0_28920 [Citricoccus parietis]|uniref:Uncharacterized protein n=1 Tax=Citricoccus parietis TaxID=592307 RepID=A0ABV5FW41_9MICC
MAHGATAGGLRGDRPPAPVYRGRFCPGRRGHAGRRVAGVAPGCLLGLDRHCLRRGPSRRTTPAADDHGVDGSGRHRAVGRAGHPPWR